nr:hypothetical protein [Tanacetum cinerariifolium]
MVESRISCEVRSPDKCLLYTVRMWGDKIDSLHVACGTIFNEIIVWKVVRGDSTSCLDSPAEDGVIDLCDRRCQAVPVCRLAEHKRSIFRITWSLDGSKLVSVSDDRSARIWEVGTGQRDLADGAEVTVSRSSGPVLFRHCARVWDCCMCDSLIVTVGEDCTCVWGLDGTQLKVIKEHMERRCHGVEDHDKKQIFSLQIPNSKRTALMDSKSEYVRCMHFASEDTLYVATNNGVLYVAKMSDTGDVVWTQIFRDGKGRLTVVRVVDITTPDDNFFYTWPAEAERQLLETFWCASLGPTYVFTADPRGRLKLWNIQSTSEKETRLTNALLVAEFTSCFPTRIICLDASFQEDVLVCGDLRGNLILFPLLRDLLLASVAHIAPINYFKGAHGISSTGGDGCICYMEYDKIEQKLEFVGMKHIKELSLVQSFYPVDNPDYAIGFASANYILWNLSTETKVAENPCGGWQRPHTYFLGDVPEIKNCFAFVKDEVCYVHKYWVQTTDRIYPQNLHLQFHGREMHSLCFINDHTNFSTHEKQSGFIATGCEDGTVRLTRYSLGIDNWSASKLLGEHVGGSAVRSLCSVFKVHNLTDDMDTEKHGTPIDDQENQFLLISVGAKRVLTAWKRKISSMSFQWLSSDFPTRNSGTNLKESKKEKTNGNIVI